MSVIDTLITDRTQADVDRIRELARKLNDLTATEAERVEWNSLILKGSYEHTDLNRVAEAVEYLDEYLRLQGYQTGVIPVQVAAGRYRWQENELATPLQMAQYLQNIQALRDVLPVYATTPTVPGITDGMTTALANAIEQILVDLESTIKAMMKTRVSCGDAYCGGEYL